MSDPLTARFLSHPPHCEPAARPLTGRRADGSHAPLARSSPSRHSPAPGSAELCVTASARPERPAGPARVAPPAPQNVTEARAFADHTLRMILEVLDRRRKPDHLRPMLAAGLVDTVATLSRAELPARRLGAAALSRVHVSMVGPAAAEVFATYARGPRVFAIAARTERRTAGWRCVALRIV
ncbi:hypothetical protein G4X40_01340 [Rhodococcus sp. D2-41]|uniref:Rv3235 family protein n=1 Tax=Speluncibacter jeojiensis TaxID=2710754 RepID=UPI0024104B5C|nr:Rv3235 family protein [Rhodococcus sp. D2-41]MDG3008787.1 hypothetical protein [Rhodococcus sp. D2-41]